MNQALWAYWDEEDVDLVGVIEAWFQKGEVLLALECYAEALEAYDHILIFCPTADVVWQSRALALRALGREQEALEAEAYMQKET